MFEGVVEELVAWTLERNEDARSVNAVVGETNDGWLNDGRGRHVRGEHLRAAIAAAADGDVEEGAVGAGAGTVCFGWKGGIGTSSRRVGEFTVGGNYAIGIVIFTDDGSMPGDGLIPHLIQWDGRMHPSQKMKDAGCRLLR